MNAGLGLCTVLLAACVTSTDPGSSKLIVTGSWDYSASQTSPPATISATMIVSSQTNGVFQGSISGSENDGGTVTALSGTVAGQTVNDTVVDFDIFFNADASGRRHVATVVRDTMKGSWVENGSASPVGSFLAIRRSGP
jgi:hypothetical protein